MALRPVLQRAAKIAAEGRLWARFDAIVGETSSLSTQHQARCVERGGGRAEALVSAFDAMPECGIHSAPLLLRVRPSGHRRACSPVPLTPPLDSPLRHW
jgi:hypothetical protein